LDYSMFDILDAFQRFHSETFTYHNILNGWEATGLDPKHVNSLLVVSRLRSFLGRQKEQQSKEKRRKGNS
jgi:hypothetical protein